MFFFLAGTGLSKCPGWENQTSRGTWVGKATMAGGAAQLQPEVAPQVSHFMQAPLRTRVSWPHSLHGSPS